MSAGGLAVIGGAAGVAANNVDYGALPLWLNVVLIVVYVAIGLATLYGIVADWRAERARRKDRA